MMIYPQVEFRDVATDHEAIGAGLLDSVIDERSPCYLSIEACRLLIVPLVSIREYSLTLQRYAGSLNLVCDRQNPAQVGDVPNRVNLHRPAKACVADGSQGA